MATNYNNVVVDDGATGYWRLGEPSGLTAYDASGHGNNGTITATGITYGVAGLVVRDPDTALTFDGTNGYITFPTSICPTGAMPWTLEALCKIAAIPASGYHCIIGFGTTGIAQHAAMLFILSNGTTAQFVLSTYSGDIVSANISAATSYHVVGTYDGVNTRLYVNGALVATGTYTLNIVNAFASIGADATGHNDKFVGTIDEAALYTNITLNATQITNHYNTANANTISLYAIPQSPGKPGAGGSIIQVTDIAQAINVLQQPAGGQEIGHYFLEQPIYTANATASWYYHTLSRNSTPVSVTLDSSDLSQVGYTAATPSTDTLKSAGFHIFAFASGGPQPNPRVGGLYTVQF